MLTFSFTRYTLLTDLCTYLTDWFLIFFTLFSQKPKATQKQLSKPGKTPKTVPRKTVNSYDDDILYFDLRAD